MKITEKELKQLVQEAVMEKLQNNGDFSARRKIVQAAQNASMEFENEIVGLLNLVSPDEMPLPMQRKYFEIVEKMKEDVVMAVAEAAKRLSSMPRNDGGEK